MGIPPVSLQNNNLLTKYDTKYMTYINMVKFTASTTNKKATTAYQKRNTKTNKQLIEHNKVALELQKHRRTIKMTTIHCIVSYIRTKSKHLFLVQR